jgi:hypothetical protein
MTRKKFARRGRSGRACSPELDSALNLQDRGQPCRAGTRGLDFGSNSVAAMGDVFDCLEVHYGMPSDLNERFGPEPPYEISRNLARCQLTDLRSDGFQGSFRNIESSSKRNTHRHRGALSNITPGLQLKGATKQSLQPST